MAIGSSISNVVETLRDSASVDTVYGDPIERGDRTVVPVARVAYGFGGGFGQDGPAGDEDGGGQGAGGGGGALAVPVGALEVTDDGSRFVRASGDRRLRLAAAALGFGLGVAVGRRLARGDRRDTGDSARGPERER